MGNGLTKAGAIGWIIWLVAIIFTIIGTIMALSSGGISALASLAAPGGTLYWIGLIGSILSSVGVLLVGLGGLGLGKHVGHPLPLVSGIIGLIVGILGFVVLGVGFVAPGIAGILNLINGAILTGVFFVLLGVSFVLGAVKEKLAISPALSTATGVMNIIEGALFLSIIGNLISPFFFIPVAILNLIVFWKA